MEIKTTMTICPKGHKYDMARYQSCPFCAPDAGFGSGRDGVGDFKAAGTTGSFMPTEAPKGMGGFAPTQAPGGEYGNYGAMQAPGGNYGNFGATEAPDMGGRGLDPFSVETMIGGERADGSSAEPVVGWLVCIEGPVRGVDFRIHAGYNYIGREAGDIHIRGDQQISRQNHAMIAFDSSEQIYFVGPAAGRNLIKVNGKTVLNAVQINSYDIISIGTTKLIFVALCGERFCWNQTGGADV